MKCLIKLLKGIKKKPDTKHLPPPKKVTYPNEYLLMALKITGSFEGTGYNSVAGNFDGQGISAGILQWNLGQGSLQNKILKPFIDANGTEVLDSFFPVPISEMVYMDRSSGVKFAKRHMLKGKKIKPEWKDAWLKFLLTEPGKELQNMAAESIAAKAWDYCVEYELTNSLKAFCWFFDIVVQNGSLKGIPKPTYEEMANNYYRLLSDDGGINKETWQKMKTDDLTKTLYVWTCKRVTRNKWASDVISRKGTIAHGVGKVHGQMFNIKELNENY